MFNQEIKIEKDISVPKKKGGRTKYDWDTLSHGDSFIFPKDKVSIPYSSFRHWKSIDEDRQKYKIRSVTVDEENVRFFFLDTTVDS